MSTAGELLETDGPILNASAELSAEFPYNEDANSGDSIGISEFQPLL